MSPSEALRQRLAAAGSVAAAAREALARGEMIELSGLEQEVTEICRALAKAPRAEAEDFKAPLLGLADDLDRLTEALVETQRRLGRELAGIAARQRAAKAYGAPQED